MSLDEYLLNNNIIAISNIDTRALTRHLREKGALKGCLVVETTLAKSIFLSPAKDCALVIANASSILSPVIIQPLSAPFSRKWRVKSHAIMRLRIFKLY
jgi:carbamoylphosphate synthase small subunit